ncbi:DUF2752 domain-containing protein [uncultured Clostridium sp.]|uniref:DUF2752 domain-containing protein n=1 Tax=uncultured Clostridium sp. TaxID=59620 RepID=UPI0025DF4F46|nr:DUF2752 domain-containing protein [uncultured Clostridium sp.]
MKNFKNSFKKYDVMLIVIIFLILTRFTCLIKLITGFPCPGCGMTRAYLSMLNLNFKDAWNYHSLFWFIPPVGVFIILADKPLFDSRKKEVIFLILVFSITFSVYIYRLIMLFPNTPPMDYNKNSLFYIIYTKLKLLINSFIK